MPRLKATRPATTPAKPFLKWVGGKRQLLPFLMKHVPKKYGRYHEPFLGGGALYFALSPPDAVLSDANERLVRTYVGVQRSVEELIAALKEAPHTKSHFLALRARDIDSETDVEVAAWFIYLNKTGFNGLYRVNSRNLFNVPFGRMRDPNICDEPTLRACSSRLQHAALHHTDFRAVEDRAERGDFVYFDPPYVPLSVTSKFASYTQDGFGAEEQLALRDLALRLKKRGVHVLLSNSSAPFVRDLYKGDFKLMEVPARRNVNSKAGGRGAIHELLIK